MDRRKFLALLGLASAVPKLVAAEELADPETCFHVNTYRIESRGNVDAYDVVGLHVDTMGDNWIASGELMIPGEYCQDCGARVGD
jgi:hypothetical protein